MKVGGRPAGPLNTLLLGFLVLTQKTKVSLFTNFFGIIRVFFVLKFVDDKERTEFAKINKVYLVFKSRFSIQMKSILLSRNN